MSDKLKLNEYRGVQHIAWWMEGSKTFGTSLGVGSNQNIDLEGVDHEDRDYWAAEQAFQQWLRLHHDQQGEDWNFDEECAVFFMNHETAKSALQYVKSNMKVLLNDVPWPEWATTAIAHGWKAPKRWRP